MHHPVKIKKAFFLCLLLCITKPFNSKAQARDMVKEHTYQEQLNAMNPAAVDIFKAATLAMDAADYKSADSLYTLVHQKAPYFVHAIRRLGTVKAALGQQQEALKYAELALNMERSSANIISLAQILIYAPEADPVRKNENLDKALKLLYEGRNMDAADNYDYAILIAQTTLQLNLLVDYKNAVDYLLTRHGDKFGTHYFAAILAANQEEWLDSENEILKAKALGMPEADVKTFLDSGISSKAFMGHATHTFLWVVLAWALGFVLLYVIGSLLSNYTLSAIEHQFKIKSNTKLAHGLRSVYGFLINTAGVYYYISLPIVLLLVIALVAGIIYLFLMAGTIPIKLAALLVIGACLTIYSMIRSLLLKVKYQDPGRELKEAEAPALFALTREVAQAMGTRAIDEIRITPETDLAVYELGSWREKLRDKGKRILILGTGVLKNFKQDDFKAVIAHEYGHFSNRDTAGGAVALRVRNDMRKYYVALYNAGQATVWNLAFQFIRLYDFIFRKISNGATRLQEVLADRLAAQTYGAQAFENGLTHVITRNIEFVKLANVEIEDAKKIKRPFSNLYELSGSEPHAFKEEVEKSLNRKTSENDTHPSPTDRFRLIKGLGEGKTLNNDVYVTSLFTDWNAITLEMTQEIEKSWSNT